MTYSTALLWLFAGSSYLDSCDATPQGKNSPATTTRERHFEGTSASLAQSKHDGLFLTTCTIAPGTVAVGNRFALEVKEAFIEQRSSVGAETDKVQLLDSLAVQPKLVIIAKNTSNLRGIALDSVSLESSQLPVSYASTTGRYTIVLNLSKEQLHQKFALRLRVKNGNGTAEERSLLVQPQPIAQALDESYNSSSVQSGRDSLLLATCTVAPQAVAAGNFRLRIQEAFVENRFLIGTRTHELQLLDSGRVRPRLVLVATPDSHLGPAGAAWNFTLPDGGQLIGYQEQARVLAFDLPARNLTRPFALRLRLRRAPAPDTTYTLLVQPTAVRRQPPRPAEQVSGRASALP